MIVFDLTCSRRHRFEGWFRSSEDYDQQQRRRLLTCPQCECADIAKAPMAPAVPAKMNRASPSKLLADHDMHKPSRERAKEQARTAPFDLSAALANIAAQQAEFLSTSTWVGDEFAERSRAMHYGEAADEQIHGRASTAEAAALVEEGLMIVPLLVPVRPPDECN